MKSPVWRREVFDLPIPERLDLVEDLWDSITAEAHALPITAEQREELDKRIAAGENEAFPGDSWADVRSRIIRRSD
jgi:putative addiction module component (TIGR02574 family)